MEMIFSDLITKMNREQYEYIMIPIQFFIPISFVLIVDTTYIEMI